MYNSQNQDMVTFISGWIDKEDVVCVCMHTHTHKHILHTKEYYLAINKHEILLFAITWMDLEGFMRSEISQTERDKYHMISIICGIWKKKLTNKTKIQRSWEQISGYQRGRDLVGVGEMGEGGQLYGDG